MRRMCAMTGCGISANMQNVSVYAFPSASSQFRRLWINFVTTTRKDFVLRNSYHGICARHFEEYCFEDQHTWKIKVEAGIRVRRQLKEDAVPTILIEKCLKTLSVRSPPASASLKCNSDTDSVRNKGAKLRDVKKDIAEHQAPLQVQVSCQQPYALYGKGPRRGTGPPRNDLGKRGMVATEVTVDNQKYCPVNQLKNIALDKNGTFMTDFDPEKSKREMRKLNRKIHKEKFSKVQNQQFCAQSSTTSLMYAKFNNKKQNQMYDEKGRLLENSKDVCDCLDKDCPGCHFPCSKCSSEKCGAECRVERRWIYEQIEVEGTNLTLKWTLTKLT